MVENDDVVLERVRAIVEPVVTDREMELVDLELVGGRGNYILRVLIDKTSSVTLENCVQINRELSDLLDVEDPIPYRYTLEVSSPGMDRPFKTVRDYERAYGKLVKIITQESVEGNTEHIGHLESCLDDQLTIIIDKKPRVIPMDTVAKAHRELAW
ncbi:MAG: ribosome maturation factor RimP [Gemmatimonadota bacterium]|nr:ribosome maturation factor RimP [Gemmatimonadota bacterium]